MKRQYIFNTFAFFLILLFFSCNEFSKHNQKATEAGTLSFSSDNQELNEGFSWAKEQAMKFVSEGDPVGKWYEASLPGREAFCMRDVSHQSGGAQLLGLAEFNKNMLYKFASNISESRDWCSYWEINKDNLPVPVDYKNDNTFWYNLPANFDVLDACYRMYQWTGDSAYLNDPVFRNFYQKTTNQYVVAWDKDKDGIMESPKHYWPRGIPTYWESDNADFATGSDLVAAMYAGFDDYWRLLNFVGDSLESATVKQRADSLRSIFRSKWWDNKKNFFYTGRNVDGSYILEPNQLLKFYPLYHELITDKYQMDMTLKSIGIPSNVEETSYLPLLFYRYNQNEKAYNFLIKLIDKNLERRNYPEVSFAVVETYGMGLMGIRASASQNLVETFPHLTTEVSWAEMKFVPVIKNLISVRHNNNKETVFTNISGGEILWQASFPILSNVLNLNGNSTPCERTYRKGQNISFLIVRVKPGESFTVSTPF